MKINSFGKIPIAKNKPMDRKSTVVDPFLLIDALKYKDSPSQITYRLLRQIVQQNNIIAAVIRTRVNQLSIFSRPVTAERRMGFKIVPKNSVEKISESQKKVIKQMTHFILNTGKVTRESDLHRDNFDVFLKKLFQDRLVLDQACFEKVYTRTGELYEFFAVDGATVRLSSMTPDDIALSNQFLKKVTTKPIRYIQLIDGQIQSEYTYDELAFCPANISSDIYNNGYGISELEFLIQTITSHLWAEEYNRKFFSQGSAPKGILNVKGDIPDDQLQAFRAKWHAQVAGVSNAWKTPVLSADEVQWIDLAKTNREMEFGRWIDYLVNVICAIYQIEPSEINFQNRGGSGTGNAIFENEYEQKIKYSRDKGLRPLLRFGEDIINKHIIEIINPAYEFQFIGLDEKTEKEILDLTKDEVGTFKTLNEIRRERGLDPITEAKTIGDIVLNPQFVQANMQMGADMGGEEMPPEEGMESGTEEIPDDIFGFGGESEEPEEGDDSATTEDLVFEPEETAKSMNKSYKITIKKKS